ncbi:MAG: HAMP domain-containing histidine kinase [Hyphomicrobiales bacterium]|nr:HAMP domain-containing histidine kinase [Hyphomicrobiales bacterium]
MAQSGAESRRDPESAGRSLRGWKASFPRTRPLGSLSETLPGHSAAVVRLFAGLNRSGAPMFGLLALGFAGLALAWIGASEVATWSAFVVCAVALLYTLPIAFQDSLDSEKRARAFRRRFVLATAFCGSAWAYLVLALLQSDERNAQAFAVLVMLLVSTVMSLLAAAIPAAFVAGMLPMIVGVVALYASRLQGSALPGAALAVGVIGYFLVVVQRLQAAAARSVSFQAEKDALIAELEQAKLASDEARRRAESANLAKSRFLATMSHELRTPLNAILGFSEVMKGELFGPHSMPVYKEYSNDIHASGQHLLTLINDLLDLSRVEAGRYELKEESVSLLAVVEHCCRLLEMRAKSRNLAVSRTLEAELPPIRADERAVRQATLNLLTNAIKFTPLGGAIAIKVGWTRNGGQYVSIRDNGPGIPPEEIPIVLSPFGRGSLAQKNAEEGTGLGLPIVKGLVALHGGEFRLLSKVGEGAEAVIIFPPERVMDVAVPLEPPLPRKSRFRRRMGHPEAA